MGSDDVGCFFAFCIKNIYLIVVFFFKQKTAYEIKECDWSSDVCSSDLQALVRIKYIMFFVNRDKKYINNIKDNIDELQQKNDTLSKDLAYQKRIVQKKKSESAVLSKKQRSLKKKKWPIKINRQTNSAEIK